MTSLVQPKGFDSSIQNLWHARSQALDAVYAPWFPVYDAAYVEKQGSVKKSCLKVYSAVYNAVDFCYQTTSKIISLAKMIISLPFVILGYIPGSSFVKASLNHVCDFICPINPVNGIRTFNMFPKKVEKLLGDYLISPLVNISLRKTSERLFSNTPMSDFNNDVVNQLNSPINHDILNPRGTCQFDYRVLTAKEDTVNAYALPGGSMVVYSKIMQDLERSIEKTKKATGDAILSSLVTLADGSKVSVDLSKVRLEDVTAALIGHEMTHVASRHSSVAYTIGFIVETVFDFIKTTAISLLKSQDISYQSAKKLKNKNPRAYYDQKMKYYKLEAMIDSVAHSIFSFLRLKRSRQNEYEADITGAFLAKRAGFNPLGALYLQEFFTREQESTPDFLEYVSTHPLSENRKRALFVAMKEFEGSEFKYQVLFKQTCYDKPRSVLSHAYNI